jgi:nicotinate-nucleotide pyrophosphorylase (carboxylating)
MTTAADLHTDISDELGRALLLSGLNPRLVILTARAALAEDLGGGHDVTSNATIHPDATAVADFTTREAGTVAGVLVARTVLEVVGGGDLRVEQHVQDGDQVKPGEVLFTAHGRTRDLLTAERVALNLLSRLSGIATLTRSWVDAVAGTDAKIRDTRKTTPGLRALEKSAVRAGGGVNHRMSLSDAAMVKDNHVVAAGGVVEAFTMVRETYPDIDIEVEVDRLDQLEPVLAAGAALVLLDNMSTGDTAEAVRITAGRAKLEASGGLTLDNARAVADTGVDYLAVGALTHSAPILDVGVDLRTSS